jgi:hypothetical protein
VLLLLLLPLLLLASVRRSCVPCGQVGLRGTILAACAMRLLSAAARAGSHAACPVPVAAGQLSQAGTAHAQEAAVCWLAAALRVCTGVVAARARQRWRTGC